MNPSEVQFFVNSLRSTFSLLEVGLHILNCLGVLAGNQLIGHVYSIVLALITS